MSGPKQMIRILVATPYGENGPGGIDRLNDAIFEAVAARPELMVQLTRLVTRGQRGLIAAQITFALALAQFCVAAIRGNVELLHIHLSIHGSSYRKTIVGIVSRLFGIPYIIHLHGIDFREFWSNANPLLAGTLDRLFMHSAQTIVLGKYWAEIITERLPSMADKITIIPNATRARQLAHVEAVGQPVRITFLGQLGPRKGTPQLIAALARLSHRNDWSATIAGDGDITESQEAVKALQIDNRVTIPGWLDIRARDELLRSTDILVLPSFAENLPMVIIEAFAEGVAVVSTPVGAIPEVIEDGRNGILIPVGNVEALTEALERLVNSAELRQRLANAARCDHAKHFEFDLYIERLTSIWRKSVSKNCR